MLNNYTCKKKKHKADEQAKLEQERQKQEQSKEKWTGAESKLKGNSKLITSVKKIIDTLKVQITTSTECVEPNDVFIKNLFRFGVNSFKKALTCKNYHVKEKKQTAKKDAVFSKLSIQNAEGYEDDNPLTEFDRAVLGILISEYDIGNRYNRKISFPILNWFSNVANFFL